MEEPLGPRDDVGRWKAVATVEKWESQEAYDAGAQPTVEVFEENMLLNGGINRLLSLLIGTGGTPYNAANCRLGIGNSQALEAATQTDLVGDTRYFKRCDSGYPSLPSGATTVTWRATYGEGEANFQWNEWGIDNGTANGTVVAPPLLNRRVPRQPPPPDGDGTTPRSMGTKVGGVWSLTVSVTIV